MHPVWRECKVAPAIENRSAIDHHSVDAFSITDILTFINVKRGLSGTGEGQGRGRPDIAKRDSEDHKVTI